MVCKTAQEVTKNELFANTFWGPKESSAGLLRVLAGCASAMSWFWWVGRSRKGCVGWIGMSKARVTVLDRLSVVNVKRMTVLWLGGEGWYSFCDFWGAILKTLAEPTLTSVWWLPLMLLSRSLRASVKMAERPFHGIYTNSFAAELACHIGNLEFCACWEMQTCISSINIIVRQIVELAKHKRGFPFAVTVTGYITGLRLCFAIAPATNNSCFRTLWSALQLQNYQRELCGN